MKDYLEVIKTTKQVIEAIINNRQDFPMSQKQKENYLNGAWKVMAKYAKTNNISL